MKDHLLWLSCMVLRLSIRSNRTNGEHRLRPEKKCCQSEKWISLVELIEILLCIFFGWGIVHSLSICLSRSDGEWYLRPEKKSCRSEKWISLVGLRNTAFNILWLRYCAMFVDPFESFGCRMAFTTREKYLSIRKMNLISTVGLTNIKDHWSCGPRSRLLRIFCGSSCGNHYWGF